MPYLQDTRKNGPPDLLADQGGFAHFRIGNIPHPLSEKQLAQKRVQRLLLTAELLAPAAVLLVQGAEEPLKDEESALLRVGLSGGGNENGRVFCPVGRILGERGGGKDEWRRGQGGQVSSEGGDGLGILSVSEQGKH